MGPARERTQCVWGARSKKVRTELLRAELGWVRILSIISPEVTRRQTKIDFLRSSAAFDLAQASAGAFPFGMGVLNLRSRFPRAGLK